MGLVAPVCLQLRSLWWLSLLRVVLVGGVTWLQLLAYVGYPPHAAALRTLIIQGVEQVTAVGCDMVWRVLYLREGGGKPGKVKGE